MTITVDLSSGPRCNLCNRLMDFNWTTNKKGNVTKHWYCCPNHEDEE